MAEEGVCQVCDHRYPVWFAPNPLWNATIRANGTDEWNYLCPTCFANIAHERGVHTGAWVLTDEVAGYQEAAHLAYTVGEIIRQASDAHDRYRNGQPASQPSPPT